MTNKQRAISMADNVKRICANTGYGAIHTARILMMLLSVLTDIALSLASIADSMGGDNPHE